MKTSLK